MSRAVESDSFRFRPPAIALPAGAAWALHRGLGPAEGEAPSPPGAAGGRAPECSPEAARAWALKLDLRQRIAARGRQETLAAEIGAEEAASFLAASHRTAARNLALRELAAIAVRTASRRGIEALLLKGMALLEEIPDLDSRRPLADVDLLVEAAAASELSLALEAQGLLRETVHESRHHLPALRHPRLGMLEIHLYLPGVGRAGGGSATAGVLVGARECHPATELAPARVPSRQVLAAHAIAHAVVQSAHAPAGYPLLRLVADLDDLCAGAEPVAGLVARAAPWLADSVSARELAAVSELCRSLTAGSLPAAGSDAALILDHVVAAHLDAGYRRSLEMRALGAALGRRDWLKIRRRAARPAYLARFFRVGWSWLSQRFRRGGAA